MTKKKETFNAEYEYQQVGGVDKKPIGTLAETIGMIVSMISRVNTIKEATEELQKAKDLQANGGDVGPILEAVVGRLWNIGKAPKGLEMRDIQNAIDQREPEKIITLLEGFAGDGEGNELVLGLVDKGKKILLNGKAGNDVRGEETSLRTELANSESGVDRGERVVMDELNKVGEMLGSKSDMQKVKEGIEQAILAGQFSVFRRRELVGKLKGRIAEAAKQVGILEKKNGIGAEDLKQFGKAVLGGNALEAGAEIMIRANESHAKASRFEKLLDGFAQVEEGLKKGIDTAEMAKRLKPEEIRELRRFLKSARIAVSGVEVKNVEGIPNFDADYVEFVNALELGDEDRRGLMVMITAIDSEYVEPSLTRPEGAVSGETRGGVKGRAGTGDAREGTAFDQNEVLSDTGTEALGYYDSQFLGYMAEDAEKRLNELYEQMPDGSLRPKSYEKQLEMARRRQAEMVSGREAFLNIDMQRVFDLLRDYDRKHLGDKVSNPKGYSLYDMIDYDYWLANKVCKLTETARHNPEMREYFERWWVQAASYEVRRNAYEGQFEKRQTSTRMILWNSLNEIVGVGTEYKAFVNWKAMSFAVVDQQNNSLANNDLFMRFAKFWGEQGVDFRLENMLKGLREDVCLADKDGERGEILGSISMFDTATFLQLNIDDDIRREFGVPDWQKDMTYGTLLYKYSEGGLRSKVTARIWERFLNADIGVGLGINTAELTEPQMTELRNMYSTELHLGMNYASTHQFLHTMIGDASFEAGKIELPGALAEGHLKQDDILYSKLFVPRFNFLGNQFKELYAYFDSGVRDHVTMAMEDYAGHFVNFNDKGYERLLEIEALIGRAAGSARQALENEKAGLMQSLTRVRAGDGAPTILSGMIGKDDRNGITLDDLAAAYEIKKTMDGAIWHYGIKPHSHGEHHHDAVEDLNAWGVQGEKSTAYRRRVQDIRKQLLSNVPSHSTLERIDWTNYANIAKNPKITEYLLGDHAPEEKWNFFAKTFGEYSFDHASAATKRVPDHVIKYLIEYRQKYLEAWNAFMLNPFDKATNDKLNDIPQALNQAAVPHLVKKRTKGLMNLGEQLGTKFLGGGSAKRIKRGKKDNQTYTDKLRRGANGLPIIETELVENDSKPWDVIKKRSVAESIGFGVPTREYWMEFLRGMFTEGSLSEEEFKHLYREIESEVWYEPKLGPIVNAWRYVNLLDPLIEYLAPKLGITGHELRHILVDQMDSTLSQVSKHIFGFDAVGASGGGHH